LEKLSSHRSVYTGAVKESQEFSSPSQTVVIMASISISTLHKTLHPDPQDLLFGDRNSSSLHLQHVHIVSYHPAKNPQEGCWSTFKLPPSRLQDLDSLAYAGVPQKPVSHPVLHNPHTVPEAYRFKFILVLLCLLTAFLISPSSHKQTKHVRISPSLIAISRTRSLRRWGRGSR